MIRFSLDQGNTPSVLAALASPGLASAVVNAAAESYVDDTHEYIKAGNAFTPRTGQLEQSINWFLAGDGQAEIYANAEHAGFVEFGTGPHVIMPKNRQELKIPVGGGTGYVLSKSVNHPGSKPHPFFFADLDNRQQHMQQRALSVVAAHMAKAGGGRG